MFVVAGLDEVDLDDADVVVSSHACGRLTDVVLSRAIAARARVAVLPCCHDLAACDSGDLSGWIDGATAIDVMRAVRLAQGGYRDLDADDSRRHHAEEPAAAWFARTSTCGSRSTVK